MRDTSTVQRHLGAVCRGSTFSTNLFAAGDQIERWCKAGQLGAVSADGVLLLLRADRDFHHLFHVAEEQRSLRAALTQLPGGTYVADLVGHGAELEEVCASYLASGFGSHTFLQRMVRVQEPGPAGEGHDAAVAGPGDARAVAEFLDRLLDPFAEQVPDAAELEREARAGRLLIVRRDDAIAGMLMYELKGRTAQLRFWHVDEHARGEGIGRRLMAAFLERCAEARRLVLWVIGDNSRSIAIYRHYGFAPDGLLDRIMILRKEPKP